MDELMQQRIRQLLESAMGEYGTYEYHYYLLIDNGEVLEKSAVVKMGERDPNTAPSFDDPEIKLRNKLTPKILDIIWPVIEERVRTRVIIHFKNAQTRVSISE